MIAPSKIAIFIGVIAVYIGYFTHQVQLSDAKYAEWNNSEWHIDQFSRPSFPIRFINAHFSGANSHGGDSKLLSLMRNYLVTPALDKVVKLMEQADDDDIVPKILCDSDARSNLIQRVDGFYTDIQSSQSLTYVGKILLYATSHMSLTNHHGLLTIGMKKEVHLQKVKDPVFIASLSRTGSTILHRTMTLDTQRFRSFDFADMIAPMPKPIPRWDKKGRMEKAKEATKILNGYDIAYPGQMKCMGTMHGVYASEAEEELFWYNYALGHPYMEPLMKLYPEHRQKEKLYGISGTIESKDVAKYRYAWLELIMKIYQYTDEVEWENRKQSGGRAFLREHSRSSTKLPWLMKDPNHSAFLPELLEVFPDAKLIFTHRDPGEIVPSLAKLSVIFTAPDFIPGQVGSSAKEWGQEALRRLTYYANGLVDFTTAQNNLPSSAYSYPSNGTSRIDLSFVDLRQDVQGAIGRIYEQLYPDEPRISNVARRAFKTYLEQNRRDKHGNQRRSLGDFHLTKEDVAFTDYNRMFLS